MEHTPPPGYRPLPHDPTSRGDFQKPQLDSQVQMYGEYTWWEKVAQCPCGVNSVTDQPDPLCPICGGTGWEYYDKQLIRAYFMGPDYKAKAPWKEGDWWGGDVTITVLGEHPVGWRHRLTMRDKVIEFSERTERAGTVQRLRYPVGKRVLRYCREDDVTDTIDVTYRVLRLTWVDSARQQHVLEDGIDFVVTEAGNIDWDKGDARGTTPREGHRFAVTYVINPPWIVTSLAPHATQTWWAETGVPEPTHLILPCSFRATLDFFMRRTDGDA